MECDRGVDWLIRGVEWISRFGIRVANVSRDCIDRHLRQMLRDVARIAALPKGIDMLEVGGSSLVQ